MAKKAGSKGSSGKGKQETELEMLRRRVVELEQAADRAEAKKGLTKREIAKASAWVTPIVLAVNMPRSVFAAGATSPVSAPTFAPVLSPTFAPVTPPTFAPVLSPTFAPVTPPTFAPVIAPTFAPVTPPTFAPVAPPPTFAPITPPP